MKLNYNAAGSRRRELARAISEITGRELRYLGMPTAAYQIGEYLVDRNGNFEISDSAELKETDMLIGRLLEYGFEHELPDGGEPIAIEKAGDDEGLGDENLNAASNGNGEIVVTVAGIDEETAARVNGLIDRKGVLIRHSLGFDRLETTLTDKGLVFRGMCGDGTQTADDASAAVTLFSMMAGLARRLRRTNRTDNAESPANEKYAMRCFLIRLGMVGAGYKEVRRTLMARLSGSSAFRDGRPVHDEV